MRRPMLIGALVAAALILGAASSAHAVTIAECAGGGWAEAWSPNGNEIAWVPAAGNGICSARPDGNGAGSWTWTPSFAAPMQLQWARTGLLVASDGDVVDSVYTRARPRLPRIRASLRGNAPENFLDRRQRRHARGRQRMRPLVRRPGSRPAIGGWSTPVGDSAYENLYPFSRLTVFTSRSWKYTADDSDQNLGIWTARTDGTHVQQIGAGKRARTGRRPGTRSRTRTPLSRPHPGDRRSGHHSHHRRPGVRRAALVARRPAHRVHRLERSLRGHRRADKANMETRVTGAASTGSRGRPDSKQIFFGAGDPKEPCLFALASTRQRRPDSPRLTLLSRGSRRAQPRRCCPRTRCRRDDRRLLSARPPARARPRPPRRREPVSARRRTASAVSSSETATASSTSSRARSHIAGTSERPTGAVDPRRRVLDVCGSA